MENRFWRLLGLSRYEVVRGLPSHMTWFFGLSWSRNAKIAILWAGLLQSVVKTCFSMHVLHVSYWNHSNKLTYFLGFYIKTSLAFETKMTFFLVKLPWTHYVSAGNLVNFTENLNIEVFNLSKLKDESLTFGSVSYQRCWVRIHLATNRSLTLCAKLK